MTIAEAVGQAVAALGCRQVFGVVGSGNFVVTRVMTDSGAGFVAAQHETAAVTMADAWARVTGEVGVATVHQGPGFTNCAHNRAGRGDQSGRPGRAGGRHVGGSLGPLELPGGRGGDSRRGRRRARSVHTPATALADVTRAFRRAALERRTVALALLPLDVKPRPMTGRPPPAVAAPATRMRPAAEAVAAAANLGSGRPAPR